MPEKQSYPLLSESERSECSKIVDLAIVLISQRAQALLLIDSGGTHADAARQTGLSIGQVRYALNRFKQRGLLMFPELPDKDRISDILTTKENSQELVAEPKKKKKSKKKKKADKKRTSKKDKKKKIKKDQKKDRTGEKKAPKKKKQGKKSKKNKKK
jgi:hypothetical protein